MIITSSGCHVPEARPWNGWEAEWLRGEMKISQELFGSLFGVSARTVREWEKKGTGWLFTNLAHRHLLDTLHDYMKAARKTR